MKRRAVKISVSITDAEVHFVVQFFIYLRGFNFPRLWCSRILVFRDVTMCNGVDRAFRTM